MGKPPNYVVFQKLTQKYLKFYNSTSDSYKKTSLSTGRLKDCWGEFGVGHKNCEKLVEELDSNYETETNNYINYRTYISNYPNMLDKYTLSMKDPKRRKGRKVDPIYSHRTQGYGKDYNENF